MNAFDRAAIAIFNDPNLSLSGVFTGAGGLPIACRVVLYTGADRISGGIGQFGAQAVEDWAELLVSEIAEAPPRGATLQLENGSDYTITSVGRLSQGGLTWQVVLNDA